MEFVYVISEPLYLKYDLFKVGRLTGTEKSLINNYKRGSPTGICVFAMYPCDNPVCHEGKIHKLLKTYNFRMYDGGLEWFRASIEIILTIINYYFEFEMPKERFDGVIALSQSIKDSVKFIEDHGDISELQGKIDDNKKIKNIIPGTSIVRRDEDTNKMIAPSNLQLVFKICNSLQGSEKLSAFIEQFIRIAIDEDISCIPEELVISDPFESFIAKCIPCTKNINICKSQIGRCKTCQQSSDLCYFYNKFSGSELSPISFGKKMSARLTGYKGGQGKKYYNVRYHGSREEQKKEEVDEITNEIEHR